MEATQRAALGKDFERLPRPNLLSHERLLDAYVDNLVDPKVRRKIDIELLGLIETRCDALRAEILRRMRG